MSYIIKVRMLAGLWRSKRATWLAVAWETRWILLFPAWKRLPHAGYRWELSKLNFRIRNAFVTVVYVSSELLSNSIVDTSAPESPILLFLYLLIGKWNFSQSPLSVWVKLGRARFVHCWWWVSWCNL